MCASRLQSASAYPGQKYYGNTMVDTLYRGIYEAYYGTSVLPQRFVISVRFVVWYSTSAYDMI